MTIQKIKDYIKNKVDMYEIYYAYNNALSIEANNNETNFVSEGATEGVGIRVFKGGRLGFSYTNNMAAYKECVGRAIKIANLSKKDPYFKSFAPQKSFKKIKSVDKGLECFDAEKFSAFKKGFLQNLRAVNPKINLNIANYTKNTACKRIINSEGVDAEEKIVNNVYDYEVSIKTGGKIENLSFEKGSKKVFPTEIGTEAGKRLQNFINRKPVEGGEMQLVLHQEALASFLAQAFTFAINAENVQHKESLYTDSCGKQVMNKKITILDDAKKKDFFATRSFDAEGTPSQTNTIINRGILKTFVYDVYTANREGRKSTGNAYRTSYTLPVISTNNLIMNPGRTKDVLKEVDNGLYVTSLLGVHTMGIATGEFSLGVLEGHKVEKGTIKYPVKNAMIAGNIFQLLQEVECLSKKCEEIFCGGSCYLPKTFYPKIRVIGQKG